MLRLACPPLAAVFACVGVAEILLPDLWLGSITLSAAAFFAALPWLEPDEIDTRAAVPPPEPQAAISTQPAASGCAAGQPERA
jgi:hypothetical protein